MRYVLLIFTVLSCGCSAVSSGAMEGALRAAYAGNSNTDRAITLAQDCGDAAALMQVCGLDNAGLKAQCSTAFNKLSASHEIPREDLQQMFMAAFSSRVALHSNMTLTSCESVANKTAHIEKTLASL